MHLCFGSFSMVLLNNRKNNAVTKITVGRELLDFIDPSYILQKDDRYIYYFTDQERELPKDLKSRLTDIPKLGERFARFIDAYTNSDYEKIRRDFVLLIQEDDVLPGHLKEHLLRLSKELELPLFLAEVFVFAVDRADNRGGAVKPRMSRKRFNLMKQIRETLDNEMLCNLAQIAIVEQDVASLTACLDKMTNHVYIARALVFLSQDESFAGHPDYMALFHAAFSKMENNKYRHRVFEDCLEAGYFSTHPEPLLEPHLREYTNNRYTYDTLILLCERGLRGLAEQYRHLLTNKTYTKRLDTYLAGQG